MIFVAGNVVLLAVTVGLLVATLHIHRRERPIVVTSPPQPARNASAPTLEAELEKQA
jgi:hypothetical protein